MHKSQNVDQNVTFVLQGARFLVSMRQIGAGDHEKLLSSLPCTWQSSRVFRCVMEKKNDGYLSTFTIAFLLSRHLYDDDEAGDRNLNLGSATFTVCRCNLSPGYSPILPFVIPRNVNEPPKMPPKEIPRRRILRHLTVAGKRSLHHVTTFISSFQKMRTARLKCTEDLGLVLLSKSEGERVNRACIAKDAKMHQGDRSCLTYAGI